MESQSQHTLFCQKVHLLPLGSGVVMKGVGMGLHGKLTGIHGTTVFSPLASQSESIHLFQVLQKHVLGKKSWNNRFLPIFATNIRFPYIKWSPSAYVTGAKWSNSVNKKFVSLKSFEDLCFILQVDISNHLIFHTMFEWGFTFLKCMKGLLASKFRGLFLPRPLDYPQLLVIGCFYYKGDILRAIFNE